MDKKFIEARVWQKVDTEANWLANTLPLGSGEQAFVSDKNNFKVNTFPIKKTFAELEYFYKGDVIGNVTLSDDLSLKSDGVYYAQTSGEYGGVVVKEGYYTLLRKKDGVWSLESEVKMPSVDIDGNIVVGQTTKAVNGDKIAQYISNTSFSIFIPAVSAIGYDLNSIVYYNDKLYKSIEPDNKTLPTDKTKWKEIKLGTDVDTEFNSESNNPIANSTVTPLSNVLKTFLEPAERDWVELDVKKSHYQDNSYINQSFGITTNSLYESGAIDLAYLKSKGITKLKIAGKFDNANVIWLMGTNNTTETYDKKVSGILSKLEYIVDVEDIYEWYSVSLKKNDTKIYGYATLGAFYEDDAVKKYIDSKYNPLESVLKSYLQPNNIVWEEISFPSPGDTEIQNKFCATDGFGIYDSVNHNIGYLHSDFLKNYDYIKMSGGMDTVGSDGNWLWLQDIQPTQSFESVLKGIINEEKIVEINHSWQGYGYTRHKMLTRIWVGKSINSSPEDDAVYRSVNKTMKDKIVNGDKPQLIQGFNGLSGEATVLKFKGKTLLYCTEGWQTEIITVHDYDIETNKVSNRSIVADSSTTGISAQTFKASCFFVLNQKVYMVCTTWNINSAFMMESTDGRNFTMVSTTLADISGFKPYLYGNHWICPEKVNDYYYWFIEGTNSAGIWQMKLMKSKEITSGWELVGNVEGLNPSGGAKGGPCVYIDNGKFKMVYHYAPAASNLPTYLAYAESNIEDPLYFTPLVMPLLDITYKPYPVTDQVADPELFEIDGKMYLICTIVDNTNGIAHLHRWDGYGRLYNALGSRIE